MAPSNSPVTVPIRLNNGKHFNVLALAARIPDAPGKSEGKCNDFTLAFVSRITDLGLRKPFEFPAYRRILAAEANSDSAAANLEPAEANLESATLGNEKTCS